MDPADIVKKDGSKALNNLLKYHISSFDYIVESCLSVYDVREPGGKESIIREFFRYFVNVNSEIKRNIYLKEISEITDIDLSVVKAEFKKFTAGEEVRISGKRTTPDAKISVDLFLMLAIISNRGQFPYVRDKIQIEDLIDYRAKELYILLEECFREEIEGTETILNKIKDQEIKRILFEKLASEEFSINADRIIKDTVLKIRERSLKEKSKKVTQLLKNKKPGGDEYRELLYDKMFFEDELKRLRTINT